MNRRAGLTAWGIVLAVTATACGVPLESSASATPASDLPYGLSAEASADSSQSAPSTNATIYLVADDRLVAVRRTMADPANANALVMALTTQPLASETARGMRRALNSTELVGDVSLNADLATVELTEDFSRLSSKEQVLALGQVVFTLTELDEVERVRFTRNGEPLAIPTDTGSLIHTPVTRYDYRLFR